MGIDESRSLHRSRSFKAKRRKGFRNLLCENLERREVMAGSVLDTDFRLLSVAPNTGEILSTTRSNTLNESPRELIFRFAGGADVRQSTLQNGIVIARAGGDGVFGPGGLTDVIVTPAYLDFEDPSNRRVVVARFSETLPDDLYRVEILGVGQANAVRNVNNDPLVPRRTLTDRDTYSFNLELGSKISAIVPQPITRAVDGTLSQARDTIDVYFNDGELYDLPVVYDPMSTSNPSVVDPRFYNLIFTGDSTTPFDDVIFNPTGLSFNPGNPAATPRVPAKVTLTFANDIHALGGSGTYRLRIGSELNGAAYTAALTPVVPGADPEGFLAGAFDVNAGAITGSFSTILEQEIRTVSDPLLLDFPGSSQEPGHRDIQEDRSLRSPDVVWGDPNFLPDGDPQIRTIKYNFMENQSYGVDSNGRRLFTSINSEQKQRVREIFEFYSRYLGVDFQEYTGPTAPGIFNIVVGDMIPIRTLISGPGDVLGAAGQVPNPDNPMQQWDMVILDNSEPWDNAFGFGVSQKPLGAETVPSGAAQQGPFSFFNTAMHEIGHLLGFDHTFDLPAGTIMGSDNNGGTTNAAGGIDGTRLNSPANPLEQIFPGTIDQIHGQHLLRPDNRDVDLYRFEIAPNTSGQVRLETIAERLNDSSSLDTHLTLLRRDAATGELSIVAANNNYFSQDSFIDVPLTSGEYFVAVTGKGNEDNNPRVRDTGSGATSQGRYQLRFEFKATNARSIAEQTSTSNAIGSALDGDGDGVAGGDFNFWFRAVSGYGEASVSPRTLVVDKSYTGLTSDGTLLQPYKTISEAISKATGGDIIRLTGVEAAKTNPTSVKAYEIGTGDFGVLSDGDRLEVPKDVTLMIDAGSILKFGNSRLLVGSDGTVDRSGAAVQVLGTPQLPVYFTSYTDQSLGEDTNVLITVPKPGDWGGIEIRNDFDRSQGRFDWEREGIFLNTISNAEMTFGGGLVGAGAQAKVTSPIELAESRPLILGNTITKSADSAISADPNSFEETLFTEPRYQNGGGFVPDYRRVGPAIYNNKITGNTINGLFMRVDTLPGQPLKTLTTHARIDDTEVSIVFGENFVIAGTPGGPLNEIAGPNTTLMIVERVPGGGFVAPVATDLDLEYLVTYVDRFGQESLPSASTPIRVPAGQTSSVRLRNIPAATIDYVSRKIYRRNSPTAPFELVVVLNRDDRSFTDNNVKLPGALQTGGLLELNRARQDGSLVIDPGMVAKFRGTRLEVGLGATLIAEGTEDKPIIFTSRLDDRYGAGGTFDTNNDGATSGSAGEWSGIFARHMSTLSIDFARITFGGGDSRIPGGFATFSPIEVYQADARIANSLIERNASGRSNPGSTNRDARGNNDDSAIFVLSSQPVIINNIIRNNYDVNPLAPTTPDGKTAAISVDLSSLSARNVRDSGRATGFNNRETNLGIGNYGPLVFNNRLGTNGLNGMRVRGGTLMSESIWDDTDIVHILQSEVIVPDFHTFGGLRLVSKVDSSLVVKAGNNAGITAAGRPLDIKDRIGGTVQILGSPGFPVVITSLKDDSIGAGFDDQGGSLKDTDGNRGAAAPGDWRSIRFTPFSNDRNVDMNYEKESDQIAGSGDNDVPSTAQDIGKLAGDLKLGDENLRLGITLTGTIGTPSDMDVYRFSGVAGSTVWFDIDQSSGSLDSMVELIDASGRIMALSDDALLESIFNQTVENPNYPTAAAPAPVRAYPMDQLATLERNIQAPGANVDFQGTNPRDPGMRVILPGVAGTTSNYFVRVRSSNKVPVGVTDPYVTSGGQTIGAYKLHLRLQEKQEIAGSTVRFADLRFSTNGVEIYGNPMRSPLLGEFAELSNDTSNSIASVLDIGNVMINDRAGVSISGTLASENDIDWFDFQVGRDDDSIQTFPSTTSNDPIRIDAHQSLIFDIDYADGLGRPNTQLWIFSVNPTSGERALVLRADESNIQDDQPAILKGTDQNDLTRGSMGKRDAYIGPIELPPGQYTVAITNKSVSAVGLRQFTSADISGTVPAVGLRLEPLDSVRRIAEDRFDFQPPSPLLSALSTNAAPVQVAFGEAINSTAVPNAGNVGLPNAVPFNLSDVTLFASTGRNVQFLNALTGAREAIWSTDGVTALNFGPNGNPLNDLAVAPNGQGVGFQTATGVLTDANAGTFVGIDIGNTAPGNATSALNTFISRLITPVADPPTFETIQVPNVGGNVGVGMIFDGLTFSPLFDNGQANNPSFWGVARRSNSATVTQFQQPVLDQNLATVGLLPLGTNPGITKNIFYRLNSINDGNVGQARSPAGLSRSAGQQGLGAGTNIVETGYFVRTPGTVVGGAVGGYTPATGVVTGLATLSGDPTRFYAVTDAGELMRMTITSAGQGQVWSDSYTVIRDPETNAAIAFSSLTAGPRNLEGGRYANLLFGIGSNGRIYAFNPTGALQPVFPRGASFIQAPAGVSGIDFSSLDVNLWHATLQDSGSPGHGRLTNVTNSRPDGNGTRSLKFGFSNPNANPASDRQIGNWGGIYNVSSFYDNTSLPGGAMGAIESDLIDLQSYSADDQPMLYFNYFVDGERTNSPLEDNSDMLDSLRVYGVGEDGVSVLLATNNSARTAGSYDGSAGLTDEFDVTRPGPFGPIPVNNNQDVFGRSYLSQELFDGQGWRQARVNLGALAGKRDVRLRFEFATGGDFRTGDATRGGQELIAVPGERLRDGQTFELTAAASGNLAELTQTFEFDLGLVLNLPSARSLADGDAIQIDGTTFTFTTAAALPTDILLTPGATAAEVATAVQAVLVANGLNVSTSTLTPNVLNVTGLNVAGTYQIIGAADPAIIAGVPGVTPGNIAVNVTNAMTAVQVRDAIRTSLALAFNDPTPAGNSTNIAVYPVRGHAIVLHRITIGDRGPLQATLSRVGDQFGPRDGGANINLFRASAKARNNASTLVRLDDFIIGFAERGEMVIGVQTSGASLGSTQFEPTYEYENIGGPNGAGAQEIETGTYQLEIRTAPDYGKTEGQRLALETIPMVGNKGRTFDTNDRLVKAFALDTNGLSGNIADGYFFTLSNGVNEVIFEFNVFTSPADPAFRATIPGRFRIPLSPNATDGEIALGIRNAINDNAVRAVLGVTAEINGDMFGTALFNDPFGNIIQINGDVASNLFGDSDFTMLQDLGGVPTPTLTSIRVIEYGQKTQFGEDIGDANTLREQGQIVISGAAILNSREYGINLRTAPRDLNNLFINMDQIPSVGQNLPRPISTESIDRSYPGSVRNMITLNTSRIASGPVLVNNILAKNGLGGIIVSGDTLGPTQSAPEAPVTVARIVNNTIFGTGAGSNQSGIEVQANTSPTIISNIIANFARGINLANDAALRNSVVIGANLYQSNTQNAVGLVANNPESFPIFLNPSDPLFTDPSKDRYYLRALSRAIDSSIASLEDRNLLDQVRAGVGLPTSPIIAPEFDAYGLLRSDDPTVSTPGGLGSNVFADRGAIDRVDLKGPLAVLQRPSDNDSAGLDLDGFNTFIRLQSGQFDYFEILIDERQGTGPDPDTIDTVNKDNVILTQNGRMLLPGVDYVFGYSFNSRTIRLTPLAGFWRQDSVYELTLINKPTLRIVAPSDAASRSDGDTFNVTLNDNTTRVLELDSGFVLRVPGRTVGSTVVADVTDGQRFTYTPAGGSPVTFEFNLASDGRTLFGNQVITFLATDTPDQVAAKIAAVVNPFVRQQGWPVQAIPGGRVVVGGNLGDNIDVAASSLVLSGRPGVTTAGATAVKFLPIAEFDAIAMANALTQALNRVGSGVKAYSLANGLVFIEGARAFSGMTGAPVLAAIQDLAGNTLQANRPNSLTQFTILMPEVNVDYGDAVERLNTGAISNTRQASNGVRHALYPDDARLLAMGAYADGDSDGQPSAAADADDFDSLIDFGTLANALTISDKGPARIVASAYDGSIGRSITISRLRERTPGVTVEIESVTYEFIDGDAIPPAVPTIPNALAVNVSVTDTPAMVASKLQAVILSSIIDGRISGIHAQVTGDSISLGGTSNHRFDLSNSGGLVSRSLTGTTELVVQSVATLAAGQTMFLTDGFGNTVGFQVINSAAPTPLLVGNVAVLADLTNPGVTTTPASFATALAAAINQAVRDLKLKLPTATVVNNAVTIPLDDEDGVQFVGFFNAVYNAGTAAVGTRPATPAVPVSALVTATNPGFVDAWIDWNQDNDFEDAGERIISSEPVVAGINTFFVTTPASARLGFTTARFRISSTGGLFTNGLTIGGEVEDHLIEVLTERPALPNAGAPPIAVNDPNYEVKENGRLTSKLNVLATNGILANDFDLHDPTGIRVFDEDRTSTTDTDIQPLVAPRFGDLKLNPDGSFEYTPLPHFNGVDSFVYRVTDSRMVSANTATVTLTVRKVNDDPKAFDDVRTIDEDAGVMTTVGGVRGVREVFWTWADLTNNDFEGITTIAQTGQLVGDEIFGYDTTDARKGILLKGANDRGLGSERDQNLNIVDVRLLTPQRLNPAETGGLENVTIVNASDPDRSKRMIRYAPGRNYNNLIAGAVLIEVTIEDEELNLNGADPADNTPRRSVSTLTININPINDRPKVTLDPASTRLVNRVTAEEDNDPFEIVDVSADLRLFEDPGPQSIPVTVTAGPVTSATAGGANDENGLVTGLAGQSISFNFNLSNIRVQARDPSLFLPTGLPTIVDGTGATTGSQVNRFLTFTLKPDVNSLVSGPILIDIFGIDDGQPRDPVLDPAADAGPAQGAGPINGTHRRESVLQTLRLLVAPVNDVPFAADDIRTIDEDTSITISSTTILSNDYPGHNPSLTDPRIDNEERDNPPVPPEDKDEDQRIRIVNVQLITAGGTPRAAKPGESLSTVGTVATGLSEIRYVAGTNYNNLIDGPVLVLVTIEDTGVTGRNPGDFAAPNLDLDPKQATSTLTININAMNDRPIVTLDPAGTRTDLVDRSLVGARLRLNEDPGPQTIPVTVTAGPVGIVGAPVGETGGADDENGRVPANVPGQNISFNTTVPNVTRVRAIDPSLFSVQPTITAATGSSVARMLTFTLAPDVNSLVSGPILIEIYGTDDGQLPGPGGLGGEHFNESVRQTLTLDIAPVNDVPFAADDVRAIDEDTSITISSTTLLSNDYPGHNPGVVPPRINNEERIPPETGDEDQRIRIVSVQLITSAGVVRVAKPGELLSSVGTAATGLSEIRYTPSTNYNNLIDGPVLVLVTIEDTGVTGDTDPSAGNLVPTPDPKQATSTLTININAMNDRPVVTLDPSMTMPNLVNRTLDGQGNLIRAQLDVLEDPGPQSIPVTVTAGPVGIVGAAVGVSGGADDERGRVPANVAGQNVSFNTTGNVRVRALNPSLFRVQPTITPATGASENRTLSFELAPDVNRLFIADPIRIVIFGTDDGQPAGDGALGGRHENESVPLTLTLNVAPVNDAPEFTVPTSDINGNIIVESNEDEGVVTRLRFATDIRPGTTTSLVDEGVQSLVFDVLAFEPSVFAIQPTIDVDGTLSFQTAQDLNTKTNSIGSKDRRVLVTLRDNGVSGPSPNTNVSIARTFTMVIKPTNDPPVPRSNYQVNPAPSEDTRITVEATDILAGAIPGPPDEVSDGQTLRVTNVNQVSSQGGTVLPDYGTDPDGVRRLRRFDYIPPLNFVGVDTITYILSDVFPADPSLRYPPGQLSVTGTITLTVQGINDPPEFTSGGNVSIVEDSPQYSAPWATNIAVGPPSATDEISGPNSQVIDRFEVAITNGRQDLFAVQPAISPDGVLTFTLAKDANGIATVSAVAVDNGPGNAPNVNRSRPVTFTINVTAVNDEPDFVVNKLVVQKTEDTGAVTERDVLTRIVPAIGNNATPATALDESTQTVSITTRLKTGSSSLFAVQPSVNASGTLTFTTAPNQIGTAVFEVFATDSGSNLLPNRNTSAVKEFTIVISADNDAPTAIDDRYSTSETTVLTRNAAQGLLQNDIDPEGDSLAIASSATVSEFGAQVRVNVDGSFTYNPTDPAISPRIKALVDGQTLTDTFTYTARDTLPNGAPKPDSKESNVATVTVTVSGFNDAPVADNDPFGVPFNTTRLLNVLANDSDVDTPINVASVEIGVLPINGTATPTADGRIRYTPRTDFRGLDTFTYRVRDSLGKFSNEATVTIRVNTAPIANPDSKLVKKNVATLIDVLSNDVDPDGTLNPATLQIVATPFQGTTSVVNGQIQFTPLSGFEGLTTFQYIVSDNDGLVSNTATVTVQVVASLYQNPSKKTDVNNDGFVSPLDALILINLINGNGGAPVDVDTLPQPDGSRQGPPDFVDVNANGTVDPLDVLEVINFINSGGASGEGEGEGEVDSAATTAPQGLAWSFLTGTLNADIRTASLSSDSGSVMSSLANAAQPLANARWSSSQMSLADYLASLTDEEEELIDGTVAMDLRTGDRDAIDDAFADLFGE